MDNHYFGFEEETSELAEIEKQAQNALLTETEASNIMSHFQAKKRRKIELMQT